MLQNDIPKVDLISERSKLKNLLPSEIQPYYEKTVSGLFTIVYPVIENPKKVTSLSLEKTHHFNGKLTGIKGQYLIFEDGTVFNIRSNEGIVVKIEV